MLYPFFLAHQAYCSRFEAVGYFKQWWFYVPLILLWWFLDVILDIRWWLIGNILSISKAWASGILDATFDARPRNDGVTPVRSRNHDQMAAVWFYPWDTDIATFINHV